MFSQSSISYCAIDQWVTRFGDPTPIGWITFAAYAFAALLSWRLWADPPRGTSVTTWKTVFVLMVLLCLNKQLDLHTAIGGFLKCHAVAYDWIAAWRSVQLILAITVLLVMAVASGMALYALRQTLWDHWALLAGLSLLAMFVAVRGMNFTKADQLLGAHLWVFQINSVLELGGIALVAANALALRGMIWRAQVPVQN